MIIKINKNAFSSLQKILSIRLLYAVSFVVCLLFIFLTSIFAYKFILDTMAYSGEAMRLKKIVSPEAFDRKDFDEIVKKIQEKQQLSSRYANKTIKNIFSQNLSAEKFETVSEKNTPTTTEEILPAN